MDQATIDGLFEQLTDCWNRMDFDAMRGLWVDGPTQPLYIAEEAAEPMSDWPAVEAYWRDTRQSIAAVRIDYRLLAVQPVADGLANVLFALTWRARMAAGGPPIGGDNRGVATVCETAGGPRLVAYVEAPLAPMPFLQDVYRQHGRDWVDAP